MIFRFFLLVLFLSFAELYILVYVASKTGFLLTFSLCLLTGLVGGAMVRSQGLSTLTRIQKSLTSGQLPAREIVSGLILLVTGTLLLTPGFITDVAAFLFLAPPVRDLVAAGLIRYFRGRIVVMGANYRDGRHRRPEPESGPQNMIIDVEPLESEEVD